MGFSVLSNIKKSWKFNGFNPEDFFLDPRFFNFGIFTPWDWDFLFPHNYLLEIRKINHKLY